jgi:flavin-binding protein dodecin
VFLRQPFFICVAGRKPLQRCATRQLSGSNDVGPVARVFPFGDSATRVQGVRAYDDQIEVRAGGSHLSTRRRADMPKKARKSDSGVYRVTEIIGTSTVSWEDAASSAVAAAAKSLRDLRVAEVSKLDMKVENGKVVAYRARVSLSFKYEA